MINSTTQKAALNGEAWNKMFRQFSKFFEISGNSYLGSTPTFNAITQETRLAMNIGLNSQAVGSTYASKNYDFVNLPSFTDTEKGIGVVSSATFVAVGSTSDRKEQALLAMTTLLSPDVQTDRARSQGSFPVVEIANLSQVLASEVDAVKGKNIEGLIPKSFAPIALADPKGVTSATNANTAFEQVAKGQKDINTALREANEKTDKQLEESRAAGNK
jgi:multiple sugar transport system substrate-binding protein